MPGRISALGKIPPPNVWLRAAVATAAAVAISQASPTTSEAAPHFDRAVEIAALPAGEQPAGDDLLTRKSNDLVRRAQKVLSELGIYAGAIDGRLTSETDKAVRTYQKNVGLKVDGRVTSELVESLENSIQVRVLLKRLDKVRIDNISAARQALMSHPATRDLVGAARNEVADPTRDTAACAKNVTVRCLLHEALESAKAVFKPELRDWALGEILVAEARAGLRAEAMETASRIGDPRLIIVALRDIAEAQAAAGQSGEALAAVEIIPDPTKRADALAAIANIQMRRGDLDHARTTASRLLQILTGVPDALTQISFQTRVAVILARAGDAPAAADILAKAEAFARARVDAGNRSVALRHVANALAEMEQLPQAMTVLSDVTDDSNRTPVLITTATQQARAGDVAAALATADTIEGVRYRAVVLGRIAVAQAEKGDVEAADGTLKVALAAIDKIKFPFARSYAISRVALSMAGIGKLPKAKEKSSALFNEAVDMADRIDDNRLRAHTLWTIAAEQVRAGDEAGAKASRERADQATTEIKSTLTQVWMFSEIATEHAVAGEKDAGWTAFNQGLQVALRIDNAWGRARAFGKLAATLVELVDPGKGIPAKTW
ncbi:MAG TPA: peptidoglycan-binding domain-containing protein [Rhodospirillales bacterium]